MAFTKLTTSQRDFLVGYLRGTGKELSAAQAKANYGINQLPARMSELRTEGFKVRTRYNTVGTLSYAVSRRMIA